MSTHDPEGYQKLHDAAAYLQKATRQIITYQQQQKQQDQLRWQRLDQHISMLNQSAQSVAGSANRVVSEAAKGIREQTREAIAQGVGEEFGLIRSAMSPVVHELRSTVDAVAGERKNLSKDRKNFASIGLTCLAIGSVLAAFGSATYSASKLKEARQAQQTLGHLRELDALSTARCGDGYCASVDLKDKVEHNGKTYYRIKPRDER